MEVSNIEAKIVILGEQNVGKTSFVVVCNPEEKTDKISKLSSTIGASFVTCCVSVDDRVVRMQIWDTAGQERFRSMAPMYYRKANAAIVMYDVCDRTSFESAKTWVHELKRNVEAPVLILLVANKVDLMELRVVSQEEGVKYATSVCALFCETSALTKEGVYEAFLLLAKNLVEYEEKHSNFVYKLQSDHFRLHKNESCDEDFKSSCC